MNQAPKAGVSSEPLEVFVAARVDAVFGTQGKSRFEMGDRRIRVPYEGVRYCQSIVDVVLMGFHPVGLTQVLDRKSKLARI
jgi:hypothetical protein